jgi:PGF-pre-PGF domain-containing protein
VHPISACWFNLNSGATNNTLASCANTTVLAQLGNNTLWFYANDTVSNENNTVSVSFTITTTTSTTTTTAPSSSGGGGGAPVTIHKSIQKFIEMLKGVVHKIMMVDKEIGFKQIIIEVRNNANNITITITKLDGKPATVVHNITGKVYQYMEIDHDNLNDSNIKSAKLRFNVTKTWINGNNFTKEHIYLNRYSNNAWEKLRTTIVGESSTEVEYEADTPGFSTFAITGEAPEITTTTTTIPIIPTPEVTTTIPEVTTTTIAELPEQTDYNTPIMITVIIIILALGWLY